MASYTWTTGVSGDWNTGTLWTPGTVPNDATADVAIDAPAPAGSSYVVTIAGGVTETVNSLTMNSTVADNNAANSSPYNAAELELDGTLAFGPTSAGAINGSLQTFIHTKGGVNAEIINGGTINGFVQVEGNLLLTGTNGVYITNDLQALAGTATIDTTSIAEMSGTLLFDGIFEAKGGGALIDLGGTLEGLIVNIATVEGPPLNPGGWTELTFNDPTAQINEWNGTAYVGVETTLTDIKAAGTVDVLDGRNYTTVNTLTIEAGSGTIVTGMLNLGANINTHADGTITTAGINIAGGVVQGAAVIAGGVLNNGTLIAEGGTLDLTGSLTGTGSVGFDFDQQAGTIAATGATLIVNGVSAGQTITMDGRDTLVLAAPSSFAGTIKASVGDRIVLSGSTVTSAVLNNGTLVVFDGTQTVASLALAGSYSGDHFTASGSTVTVAAGATGGPTAPTVTTMGEIVNGEPTISGTALPGSTVTLRSGSRVIGAATADSHGDYAMTATTPLSPGVNSLTVIATTMINGTPVTSDPSAPVSVLSLPAPVEGDSVADLSSADLSAAIVQGATLAFITGTEATSLVDGVLSVGPDTNQATLQRLYLGLLGRSGDTVGMSTFNDQLTAGVSKADVANQILGSLEYVADHGTQTPTQLVTSLYQGLLGRAPDAGGLAAWTNALAQGVTPGDVAVDIADSPEAKIHLGAQTARVWVPDAAGTLAHELYKTGLGREVELGALPYYHTLNLTQTSSQIAAGIAASSEFMADHLNQDNTAYVTSLYQAGLGRAPDAAGLAAWTSALDSHALGRSDVLLAIATSPEASARLTHNLNG